MARKKRLKHPICQNCGQQFGEADEYCPKCGQENDDKLRSFFSYVRNLWGELMGLDNQVFRSFFPFLLRPGYLTRSYLDGKRKRYVAPVRLYLSVSFIYFLSLSNFINHQSGMGAQSSKTILSSIQEEQNQEQEMLRDSILQKYDLEEEYSSQSGGNEYFNVLDVDLKRLAELQPYKDLSIEAELDSLQMEDDWFNRLAVRQSKRILQSSPKQLLDYFLGQSSIMMFFLIPIFAMILKLLYWRRKRRYIEHLIFNLHQFSFIFFLTSLHLFISIWTEDLVYLGLGSVVLLILVYLYSYKSFRKVYQQKRFKTWLKMHIFWAFALLIFLFVLLFTLFISIFFF